MDKNVGTHPGASKTNKNGNPKIVGTHPGASVANQPQIATTSTGATINHSRKSPRAIFHDYSGGNYFITICTLDKEHYFGHIHNGKMLHSKIGKIAYDKLSTLSNHYTYVDVPLFVVMPNHIHAIISIHESKDAPGCVPIIRTALAVVIGGYKQSVTMYARRNNISFAWQQRYHDHIIRGVRDGNRIAEYIENNVARWDSDCFHPNNVGTHPGASKTDNPSPFNS